MRIKNTANVANRFRAYMKVLNFESITGSFVAPSIDPPETHIQAGTAAPHPPNKKPR